MSKKLLAWFDQHGRHDLPWQLQQTPYRVWVSEIMLQQTQVATVIPYYKRFMQRFQDVDDLAAASIDEVLHLWSGLGYYARGRNLHRAAGIIVDEHGGEFPRDTDVLQTLPGIGRSTAGAILALAHNDRHAILDGNVKRVLARYHAIAGWPGKSNVVRELWAVAEEHTPRSRVRDYTQAIMDLGATVCTRSSPACDICPLVKDCAAFASQTQDRYPGRKPRKTLPEKSAQFVIARHGGAILLQRRPSTGIWGGLWCLPELDPDQELDDWCARHGLSPVAGITPHASFAHTFTHFRLTLSPIEIQIREPGNRVMDSQQWLWYNVCDPQQIGIAKPIEQILQRIQSSTA